LRGAAPERVRKTLGGAAKKNNFARAAIAHLAQPFGELRRRVMFSRVIKQDDRCGGIESEFAEGRWGIFAQLRDFNCRETCDARHVIVHQRANFRTARLTKHHEADFHEYGCAAGVPLVLTQEGPAGLLSGMPCKIAGKMPAPPNRAAFFFNAIAVKIFTRMRRE